MRDHRGHGENRRGRRLIVVGVVLVAMVLPGASLATDRFEDVPSGNVFHDDIAWLADAGITKGCNPPANDRFCPGDPVTRAQMAAFMRRFGASATVDSTPLVGVSPLKVADGKISIAPLTATSGLKAAGQQISLNPPLRATKAVSGATPLASSVISGRNTTTSGGGTFGVFGESRRGSAVGPGAGVNGRGTGGAYGVLGEAGDLDLIAQPIGEVGVVGRGQNRGTYGSSQVGIGVYGVSSTNYGVWGQSTTWRGVTGRTGLANNNWGMYTPDNSFALNYQLQGAVMVVVENGGDTPLLPGDVVSFSGVTEPTASYEAAMPQVSRAESAAGAGIAGVVSSRFDLDALLDPGADEPPAVPTGVESTPAGPVAPGEHLLLVVSGAAQTRIDTGDDAVVAGAVLGVSAEPGLAAASTNATPDGGGDGIGIVGTALEPASGDDELIWVFVGAG